MAANYELVTAASQLEAGAKYVIGTAAGKFIATTSNANNRKITDATVTDGVVEATDAVMVFTLGGSADAWTFATENYAGAAGYLNATNTTGSNNLKVVADLDDYAYFTIAIADGVTTITCNGKTSRNILYQNGSTCFSCYNEQTSAQYIKPSLYKEVSSTPQTYYTVAGSSETAFGTVWKPEDKANDMKLQADGSYKWEKTGLELAAGTIEFKVCENHAWDVAYPSDNYQLSIAESGVYTITITYEPANENKVSAVATKTGNVVIIPTIAMHGNFTGDWADTENFEPAEGNATASLALNLAEGNYEFGMRIGGSGNWTSNGAAFTRESASHEIVSGSGNLTIAADAAGEYLFTWTFETNTLAITYPKKQAVLPAGAYMLTFKGTGDNTDKSNEFKKDDDIFTDECKAYVASVDTISKVYAARIIDENTSSLKFGTTSVKGYLQFTLATPVEVDSIIVNATQYGKNAAEVTVNGTKFDLTAGNKVPTDCKITPEGKVSAITIAQTGSERIYLRYVTVYPKQGGEEPVVEPEVKLPVVAIAGTMNEWSAEANVMVAAEDSLSASVKIALEAQDYAFKIVSDGKWLSLNGEGESLYRIHREWNEVAHINGVDIRNFALAADVAGEYTFTWTYADSTLVVTFPEKSEEPAVTDQVLFSAKVIATANQSFEPGTTVISAEQATITGGSMSVISEQTSAKNLIATQNSVYYFTMTNNNTFFKVELNQALAVGDVISADVLANGAGESNKRGIWVSTEESRPSEAPAAALTAIAEAKENVNVKYTVAEEDEYVGKKVLYIYRETSNSTYFDAFKVTRAAGEEPVVDPAKFYITGDSALVVNAGLTVDKAWNPAAIKSDTVSYKLNLAAGDYKLKVVVGEGEAAQWKGFDALTTIAKGLTADESGNICFTLTEAGEVNVHYDGEFFFLNGNFYVAPVEVKYYLKNNWGGEAWTWKEMTALGDGTYMLYNVVVGGEGVNRNTAESEEGASWFAWADIETFDASYAPATIGALDTVVIYFDPEAVNSFTGANGMSAQILGKYVAPVDPQPAEHTYTVAGNLTAAFGTAWDPAYAANDMVKQEDGTYKWEKAELVLPAGTIEFKVCEDHAWTVNYPAQNYQLAIAEAGEYTLTITFDPATQTVAANAEKTGTAEVDPTVSAKGSWDEWANELVFTLAADKATASLTVNNVKAGTYEFKVILNGGEWRSNGYKFTREAASVEGITGNDNANMKLVADVDGTYTFTWTFATNALNITFPAAGPTALDNINADGKAVKVLRNGQILIKKGDKTYNVMGAIVR